METEATPVSRTWLDEDAFAQPGSEPPAPLDLGWQDPRRLPVYLLLDCSASMAGAAIEAVNEGVKQLHTQLLDTPTAVETVSICIITFGTEAQRTPLQPISEFTPPELRAGGATSLGQALLLLEESLDTDVRSSTAGQKGDWRPLVFLLTDGDPTDKWTETMERLKNRKEKKIGTLIALGCGDSVDFATLRQITDYVLRMEDVTVDRLRAFFKWVSQSVSGASVSPQAATSAGENLPPLPEGVSSNGLTTS